MKFLRFVTIALFVAGTGLSLSACGQRAATLPAASLDNTPPQASPPDCKGQKSTKQYATLTAPLNPRGGTFCIPAIGGFGGNLKYPDVSFHGSVDLTLTSSVKNYNHQPQLGSGKPIFYLQFAISGGVLFGRNLKAGGSLTGQKIVSGNPYTLYGQAIIFGQKISLGPCSTTATKGKYGGVIGGFGTLVEHRSVPYKASGVIEVYSGEQTTSQC